MKNNINNADFFGEINILKSSQEEAPFIVDNRIINAMEGEYNNDETNSEITKQKLENIIKLEQFPSPIAALKEAKREAEAKAAALKEISSSQKQSPYEQGYDFSYDSNDDICLDFMSNNCIYISDSKKENESALKVLKLCKENNLKVTFLSFLNFGISEDTLNYVIDNYIVQNDTKLSWLEIHNTLVNNAGIIKLLTNLCNNKTLKTLVLDEAATRNIGVSKALLALCYYNQSLSDLGSASIYENHSKLWEVIFMNRNKTWSFCADTYFSQKQDYEDNFDKKQKHHERQSTSERTMYKLIMEKKTIMVTIKEITDLKLPEKFTKDLLEDGIIGDYNFIKKSFSQIKNYGAYFENFFANDYTKLQQLIVEKKFTYPENCLDFIKLGFASSEINFNVLLGHYGCSPYDIILINQYAALNSERYKLVEKFTIIPSEMSRLVNFLLQNTPTLDNLANTYDAINRVMLISYFKSLKAKQLDILQNDQNCGINILQNYGIVEEEDEEDATQIEELRGLIKKLKTPEIDIGAKCINEHEFYNVTMKAFFKVIGELEEYKNHGTEQKNFLGNIKELACDLLF